MSTVNLTLTPEQQKQIKDATGKDLSELHIDLTANGQLSGQELDKVAGGDLLTGGVGQLAKDIF